MSVWLHSAYTQRTPGLNKKKTKQIKKKKKTSVKVKCSPTHHCEGLKIERPLFNSPFRLKKQSSPETWIACWHLSAGHSLSGGVCKYGFILHIDFSFRFWHQRKSGSSLLCCSRRCRRLVRLFLRFQSTSFYKHHKPTFITVQPHGVEVSLVCWKSERNEPAMHYQTAVSLKLPCVALLQDISLTAVSSCSLVVMCFSWLDLFLILTHITHERCWPHD